ncbi:retrovirus-related Pol polyprotein from transposon 297 [Trichonephila clavipes]|nr:retrovirus-related Pol polyprotein from transposon 297 [Trichonephila clavipes]
MYYIINRYWGKGASSVKTLRYDRVKQEMIDYHIEKMLKEGTIWPIQSPYASPVVLTRKNNGLPPDSSIDSWELQLSEFNFKWELRPGIQNVVADILSRNPVDNVEGSQISCAAFKALALNSREQLIQEQREDPELRHIDRYLENPGVGSVKATVLDINHIKTVTYRPQANLTERVNRTLVQMIACFVEEKHDNWDRILHEFSFELRTAVNETTGKTPAELFLGRKIITPFRKLVRVTDSAEYVGGNIEKLFDEASLNTQTQHKTWEKYYN